MMFKRRPKNPNDMNKDVKKYLKKFEKYLKKNDVDTEYNSSGALTFVTETKDGNNYSVIVNGERDTVWLTTLLSISKTSDEISLLRAVNDLTGTKIQVTAHVEHNMNILMLTMCFNATMTDNDIDAIMDSWWEGSEYALKRITESTGIEIDWSESLGTS